MNSVFSFCEIKNYCLWKCKLILQTMRLEFGFRIAPTWPWMGKMTSHVTDITSSSDLFSLLLFLLSSLVTAPSFISISSLVLELWQFSFIKDWLEIRKSEIDPFEFFLISGDWGKLRLPNLARMSLIKYYWMLQMLSNMIFLFIWQPLVFSEFKLDLNIDCSETSVAKKINQKVCIFPCW